MGNLTETELAEIEARARAAIEISLRDILDLWTSRGTPRYSSFAILDGNAQVNLLCHDYFMLSVTKRLKATAKE